MGLIANRAKYDAILLEKKKPVFDLIRKSLVGNSFKNIIEKDPLWFAKGGWHSAQGMGIRNYLRQEGFGEDYWPVNNLDDIYVELIEEALVGKVNWDLVDYLTKIGFRERKKAKDIVYERHMKSGLKVVFTLFLPDKDLAEVSAEIDNDTSTGVYITLSKGWKKEIDEFNKFWQEEKKFKTP